MNTFWRKHIAVWRNRLYLYPQPEPMPFTRLFWLATALVAVLALTFALYFCLYLTARHDAFITSAEDLGIMDQAVWNILHGQVLHQTICNTVNDTNCYGLSGISRFAIHFEPILFPISLLYTLWPGPKTLLILQTLVVASGAFPAFWLARLRLRNEFAGVVIAALYLLFPAQQQATTYDFHAVTLTCAFLLFTLYFLYTRRTLWMFVFAILAMACKEEIPLVIFMFGLWSILFQQRWRSGLSLAALGLVWVGVAYLIMHLNSPAGHPLLVSRYAALGNNPVQIVLSVIKHPVGIVRVYVFEPYHEQYLRILLSPVAYLPLLAPWVLILALPSLAINMLSADPNMHSGFFQYNAEIVPVLIFATIEAIVLILWIVQWAVARLSAQAEQTAQASDGANEGVPANNMSSRRIRLAGHWLHIVLLVLLLGFALYQDARADKVYGAMPYSQINIDGFQGITPVVTSFQWPQTSTHIELAQHFIAMIPSDASVSAQSHLAPHISERASIYLFPYGDTTADYIFLDVTGNTYPLLPFQYIPSVKKVLLSGQYGIVAAQDGYLLLKRGLPAPGISPYSATQNASDATNALPNFPAGFCSFIQSSPQQVQNPLQVTYSSPDGANALNLVGESLHIPTVFSESASAVQITTYWKVNAPTASPVQLLALLTDKNGTNRFISNDFPALAWCPTNTWKAGTVVSIVSAIFLIQGAPNGLAHVSLAALPTTQPFSTIMDEQAWFPVHIIRVPDTMTYSSNARSLQLTTITIVP